MVARWTARCQVFRGARSATDIKSRHPEVTLPGHVSLILIWQENDQAHRAGWNFDRHVGLQPMFVVDIAYQLGGFHGAGDIHDSKA
jgi:hypothetical protein